MAILLPKQLSNSPQGSTGANTTTQPFLQQRPVPQPEQIPQPKPQVMGDRIGTATVAAQNGVPPAPNFTGVTQAQQVAAQQQQQMAQLTAQQQNAQQEQLAQLTQQLQQQLQQLLQLQQTPQPQQQQQQATTTQLQQQPVQPLPLPQFTQQQLNEVLKSEGGTDMTRGQVFQLGFERAQTGNDRQSQLFRHAVELGLVPNTIEGWVAFNNHASQGHAAMHPALRARSMALIDQERQAMGLPLVYGPERIQQVLNEASSGGTPLILPDGSGTGSATSGQQGVVPMPPIHPPARSGGQQFPITDIGSSPPQPVPQQPQAVGLENLGGLIERLLANPSAFDSNVMEQQRRAFRDRLTQEAEAARAGIEADAASRGLMFSSVPLTRTGGLRDLNSRLMQALSEFDVGLLSRGAEARDRAMSTALSAALNFGELAQRGASQRDAVLSELARIGMFGTPDINSILGNFAGFGLGAQPQLNPALFALLGQLFGD